MADRTDLADPERLGGQIVAATTVQRLDRTGPFVEITRVGRWTYSLSGVVDDISVWVRPEGDRVWGRRRAERRALKRLAQYRRYQSRQANRWKVDDGTA